MLPQFTGHSTPHTFHSLSAISIGYTIYLFVQIKHLYGQFTVFMSKMNTYIQNQSFVLGHTVNKHLFDLWFLLFSNLIQPIHPLFCLSLPFWIMLQPIHSLFFHTFRILIFNSTAPVSCNSWLASCRYKFSIS